MTDRILVQVHLDDEDETAVFDVYLHAVPRVGDELCYVFEEAMARSSFDYADHALKWKQENSRKHWTVTRVYHEFREYGIQERQRPHLIFIYVRPMETKP